MFIVWLASRLLKKAVARFGILSVGEVLSSTVEMRGADDALSASLQTCIPGWPVIDSAGHAAAGDAADPSGR